MKTTRTWLTWSLAMVIALSVVWAGSVYSRSVTTSLRAAAGSSTIPAPEQDLAAAPPADTTPVEPAESIATQSVTTSPEADAASSATPAPELDLPSASLGGSVTVVVAGGCFWGVQECSNTSRE